MTFRRSIINRVSKVFVNGARRVSQTFKIKEKPLSKDKDIKDLSLIRPNAHIYSVNSKGRKYSKDTFNLNVYLLNLHNYLGKYCFLFGAYVIEDDDQKLRTFLNGFIPYPIPVMTHYAFITDESEMYELYPSLVLECNGCYGEKEPIVIRNLKWYPFKSKGKTFVYMKLEGWPTISMLHTTEAFKRYILNIAKSDRCGTTREDCAPATKIDNICTPEDDRKDRRKSTCKAKVCRLATSSQVSELSKVSELSDSEKNLKISELSKPHNFDTYQIDGNSQVKINEDVYERKGDEFFIPKDVSHYLIDNAGKRMEYTYTDTNVTIKAGLPIDEKIIKPLKNVLSDINSGSTIEIPEIPEVPEKNLTQEELKQILKNHADDEDFEKSDEESDKRNKSLANSGQPVVGGKRNKSKRNKCKKSRKRSK
jgi:hypothetical protein